MSRCFASIKGLSMRATRVDGCGAVIPGANASVVSCGFISIGVSANIEDGEEFTQKLANGTLCVSEKDCSILKFLELEIALCEVDPELYELMTGNRIVTDGGAPGESIGFTLSEDLRCEGGVALEVWTRVAGTGGCEGGTAYQWLYWLFPNVVGGVISGDLTIENGPLTFTLSAHTQSSAQWGTGPYDIFQGPSAGTPGALPSPIEPGEHMLTMLTDVAPPECACGYQAVGGVVAAAGATAGTPGTWTPAGSTPPASVAALQGATPAIVASPTTAWATGEFMQTGTAGTAGQAYWDGSAWVAGVAP